ncbi:MAG TPA: prepilin peptidase [Caulobacterales bacterium]|nr:prepilin peptidase [Caulobacterales bacterium]
MIAILFLSIFAVLLLWAAACDVATMEIPNRISLLLVGIYPVAALACALPWQGILLHLAIGVGAFVLCWGMFMLGVFGGGDAKVLAAATVWTGLSPALSQLLLWTCIAGGGLAALAIVSRKRFKPTPALPAFVNTFLGETHLPYAAAIAVGGLFALPLLPILHVAA